MQIYTIYTLVDITATGVTRGPDGIARDQQRNWETVVQAVGLITQPITIVEPQVSEIDVKWCEFGDFYEGLHRVWRWRFAIEHADVFAQADNDVGVLQQVFEQVPIIAGLEETARFILPIFHPYGAIKNIHFTRNS